MEAYSSNTYSSSGGGGCGGGSSSSSSSSGGIIGSGGGSSTSWSSGVSTTFSKNSRSSSSSSSSVHNVISSGSGTGAFGSCAASRHRICHTRLFASSSAGGVEGEDADHTIVMAGDPRMIAAGGELVWLDEVNSTMDEAKQRVPLRPGLSTLAVQAGMQVQGRGTKGRDWFGRPGNVFLTVVLPMDGIPVPLPLLPLRVGVVIARAVRAAIDKGAEDKASTKNNDDDDDHDMVSSTTTTSGSGGGGGRGDEATSDVNESKLLEPFPTSGFKTETVSVVSLKWPNDVLVNDDKVAGVLIEGDGTYLHIGIGINVRHAPEVPTIGAQRGRTSTCLAEHGALPLRSARRTKTWVNEGGHGSLIEVDEEAAEREADEYDPAMEAEEDFLDDLDTRVAVQRLGVSVARDLMQWATGNNAKQQQQEAVDSAEAVVRDWSELANWDKPLVLRDEGPPDVAVQPMKLEDDGRLRVKNRDGSQRVLVAEYLF